MKLSEPQRNPGFRDEGETLSPFRNLVTEKLCDIAENGINYKYNQTAHVHTDLHEMLLITIPAQWSPRSRNNAHIWI